LADGFTEPQKVKGKPTQHYRFTVPGQELITFAGLYAWWYNAYTKDKFGSFAIITVNSNEQVGEVHEKQRMPAILDVGQRDQWLSMKLQPQQYLDLLQTWPDSRMIREKYDPFNKKKSLPPSDLEFRF
jgi:putative SOS response-associated peptidase YedK